MFALRVVGKVVKWAITLSLVALLVGIVLAFLSPLRSDFISITEGDGSTRDAMYVVVRQYNRINICARGGLAIDWIKSHFQTVAGQHTICAFVESEGTQVKLTSLPIIGDIILDLPPVGRGYTIHLPFTGNRLEIASGTENVLRLVDLVEEEAYEAFLKRETLKLPPVRRVEVPKHREFTLLTPGTKITSVLIDATKGTEEDLDRIPLLVDFQIVESEAEGSLNIHLGK